MKQPDLEGVASLGGADAQPLALLLAGYFECEYCLRMSTINLESVLKLPVEERIRIVEEIWDSVADDAPQVELQPWQAEELDRRIAEFEANPTEGVPWAEVKRRVMGDR
ncbi:MAG: addiction module protein [Alcaligenaceae bacterium]|nr:addiction module protein [Alcaligenaceae bacterium]